MIRTSTTLPLALLLSVAACGRSPVNEQARPTNEVAVNAAMEPSPAIAFDAASKKMRDAMMAAVGSDAGDNWVRKMIAHHQGAIDMSKAALQHSPNADAAKMARMTIDKQGKEIEDLRRLGKDGPPDQRSAELYRPATETMDRAMKTASGADVSETYLRKMIAHHTGAVEMSDVALRNGVSGAVKAQVEATRSDQLAESKMVTAMLAGQPMDSTMSRVSNTQH